MRQIENYPTHAAMNSRNSGEERKSHSSRVRNLFRYFSDSGPSSVPSDPFIGSPFASSSRLNSPNIPPHSDDTHTRYPTGSNTTIVSSDSYRMPVDGPEGSNHAPSPAIPTATDPPCSACAMPMSGQFVRALGTIFHLECFRCQDCNVVVASKFFPIEGPDGRQHPLCERDYFGRLNLICAKCGSVLRGTYITACNKKFHFQHFTCSVCPNLFGPQDSYYEHQGEVYCYFHYSTRFADKCVGCQTAILKQFVEINRNMKDECWHPECYMIHKFWNVRIAPKLVSIQAEPSDSAVSGEPHYKEVEALYDATTLRENQVRIESLVFKIWTILSSFEESSAACISDMLRHITNEMYLDSIRMAEKFILHVEVLFAAIDDLELGFMRVGAKGMSHVREARMLCRKTIDLFVLLSRTQKSAPAPSPSDSDPNGPLTPTTKQSGMTQELLALVTGLAHYLKILIRIALTGALKLDRDYGDRDSMDIFLESLHALAGEGGEPGANRMKVEVITGAGQMVTSGDKTGPSVSGGGGSDAVVLYGYRSLAPQSAGESPFSPKAIEAAASGKSNSNGNPTDQCAACKAVVEEDCVRLGTYQRWHSHCVKCCTCGEIAAVPAPSKPSKPSSTNDEGPEGIPSRGNGSGKLSTARSPPAKVDNFRFSITEDAQIIAEGTRRGGKLIQLPNTTIVVDAIYCLAHSPGPGVTWSGFEAVSRLEQYAFLLNVALRRLFLLFKKQGLIPLIPATPVYKSSSSESTSSPHNGDSDITRFKSAHLDRKLSAAARLPKRSEIVEIPTLEITQASGVEALEYVHPLRQPQPNQTQYHPEQRPRSLIQQQPALSHTPKASIGSIASPRGPRQPRPLPIPPSPPLTTGSYTQQQLQARNHSGTRTPIDRFAAQSSSDHNHPRLAYGDSRTGRNDQGEYVHPLLEPEQARERPRSLPAQTRKLWLAELTPLMLCIVKHFAVLALQRSTHLKREFELDEILELMEVQKSTSRNNKGDDKAKVTKKGIFGVPLELLVEQGTNTMLGSSRAPLCVPIFINDVISTMKHMDVSVEGIFRMNGSIRRLRELAEAMDCDPSAVDLAQEDPIQLAALLKKFLRDLPDPLMTFQLYKLWNAAAALPSESERKFYLHILSVILPKANRDTLEALFVFLKWVAASYVDEESGSKMDFPDLASLLGPSILYAKGREAAMEDSVTSISIVTELLENQDYFHTVPDEFSLVFQDQQYFANALDMSAKEVLKRAENYLNVNKHGLFI